MPLRSDKTFARDCTYRRVAEASQPIRRLIGLLTAICRQKRCGTKKESKEIIIMIIQGKCNAAGKMTKMNDLSNKFHKLKIKWRKKMVVSRYMCAPLGPPAERHPEAPLSGHPLGLDRHSYRGFEDICSIRVPLLGCMTSIVLPRACGRRDKSQTLLDNKGPTSALAALGPPAAFHASYLWQGQWVLRARWPRPFGGKQTEPCPNTSG